MKYPRETLGVKDGPEEFVVLPDAWLLLRNVEAGFLTGSSRKLFQAEKCAKKLAQGHLPIVIAVQESEGLKLEQTVFAWSPGLSPDTPLYAFVQLRVSNAGPGKWRDTVRFAAPEPVVNWELTVSPGDQATVAVRVPFDQPEKAASIAAHEFDQRFSETAGWWENLLSRGLQIDVPEQRVNDAWRAWLVYNFINVDKRGNVYEPHDGGGGFYEEVYGYSAARYCYALDLMGFSEQSKCYLDSLLTFVQPDGSFVLNYGLPDTGALLFALAQHFEITHDVHWLCNVSPTMIRMCDWIIQARQTNLAQQTNNPPWKGLIKHRPYCDEPNPAYSYHTDTYLALGLKAAAAAFNNSGLPELEHVGKRLQREAISYEKDILMSMDRSVVTRNGVKILPMFPETHALLERVGYTARDYYSLVSSMVLETGLLGVNDHRARMICNFLEQRGGLCLGMCAFGEGVDHAYTYGYWLDTLWRDDVKRAILGLYASLAYGMSRGTYAGVEVTALRTGDNEPTLPHLYSGTQQLLLLRNMLVREEGTSLWLGQAIPRAWLAGGKHVRVERAPTLFGTVSYSIRSENDAKDMIVDIDPPTRRLPENIHIRLRHPEHREIHSVKINGDPWKKFESETITVPGLKQRTRILVEFK